MGPCLGIWMIVFTEAYEIKNHSLMVFVCVLIIILSIFIVFLAKYIPLLLGQPTISINDSKITLNIDRFLLSPFAASIYSPLGRSYAALYYCLVYHQYGEIPLKSLKKVYVKKCLKKYYEVIAESRYKFSLVVTNTKEEAEQLADLIRSKITPEKAVGTHNLKSITDDDLKRMEKGQMTPLDWLTLSCVACILLLNHTEIPADIKKLIATATFLVIFFFCFLFRELVTWIYWRMKYKDA